jgi:hypothetical protein
MLGKDKKSIGGINMEKGLICSILRDSSIGKCANGGLSDDSRTTDVVLVTDLKEAQVFEPREGMPAVKIVRRIISGEEYIHAEPIDPPPKGMIGWMHGGCYIKTSDSRYSKITGIDYPIALHDRCETPEDYEALSR